MSNAARPENTPAGSQFRNRYSKAENTEIDAAITTGAVSIE